MRVLVVDDEAPARRRLIRMLGRVEGVEVVGEAADGVEAADQIRSLAPDLVFLDIQMPEVDGLSLAAQEGLPPIVFVTAHDDHALAAFEVGAVDYLLKPTTQERLERAVERVRASEFDVAAVRATLSRLQANPAPGGSPRLAVRDGATVQFFDARQVVRLWSADKYTLFRCDGVEHVLDESLNELEVRLRTHQFVRVHRAELVNLEAVVGLTSGDDGVWLRLSDGQRCQVSRRMVPVVKRALGL